MVDSDSTGPKLAEAAKLKNARDILNGMSYCRIDPTKIKIKEAQTGKRGGQGVVVIGTMSVPEEWKAIVPELKVAVKKLEWKRDDAEESAKFFKSFVNELCLMESLSHPNIIILGGFVEDMHKGDAWMILPWEGNGNVREFLQSGEWDIPERISLIQDTAKGLEYLHSRQPPVCHGDLKSFNILVNSSYRAVITDFGSARIRQSLISEDNGNGLAEDLACDDDAIGSTSPTIQLNPSTMELTLTGPKFSLRWTAPEVLNNGVQDLPSDMWALGWVGWEIVTGKIPFEELNRDSFILTHAMNGKLPAIRDDINLSLVLKLCSVMSDCWLSDPAKRIQASTFQRRVDNMPSATSSGYSAGGQKVRSVRLLLELGATYDRQDDRARAESHFLSALDLANRTKDGLAMADALGSLGCIRHAQSRYLEAEKAFTEAQEISSRLGNDEGAVKALNCLGEMYRVGSRNGEAEKAFSEMHEILSRIGNHTGTAKALVGLGETYLAQSRTSEAEKAFNDARNIYSRIGDVLGTGHAVRNLAMLYSDQGRYDDAEASYLLAAASYDHAGDGDNKAKTLLALAQGYHTQHRYPEAGEAATEALAIWISIGNEKFQAVALLLLAQIFKSQSKTDEEKDALIQAEVLFARTEDHAAQVQALDRLGDIHLAQGTYDEADECYRLSQAISSSMDDISGEANMSLRHAALYLAQHRHAEAEECFTNARVAYAGVANVEGEAMALGGLIGVQAMQGKYAEAKAACQYAEAREMYAQMNRPTSELCKKIWALVRLQDTPAGLMLGLPRSQRHATL